MPPQFDTYSSLLDGSFRIQSAKNSAKHGAGSALIQNSINLFGESDQYLKSSSVLADLYVESSKDLNIKSTSGTSHVQGQRVNLTSDLESTLKSANSSMLLEAGTDCTVKAATDSTLYLTAGTKQENFTLVNANSVADYTIKSSGANATLQADNLEARVFGGSLAHVRANATKLESTLGKTEVLGATDVDIDAVNVNTSATTKATVSAPEIDVNASVLAKVEAPTVEVGLTSDNVNISALGKETNVKGNCTVAGNFTVQGTTTQVNTEQITVKDNLMVLNSASQVGRDAGILFKRNDADATADTTAMYWSEADQEFVFASTDSAHDALTVTKKDLKTVHAKNFIGDAIEMPGFKTVTFNLKDNDSVVYEFNGLKTRGCYEFIIESVLDNGAVYNYKICKSKATTDEYVAFGIHQAAESYEEISIKWEATKPPAVYHKVTKNGGSGADVAYVAKYISVN
jgi:hypothetical protein